MHTFDIMMNWWTSNIVDRMLVDLMNLVECIHSPTPRLFLVSRNTMVIVLLHAILNNIQNLTLRHNIDLVSISWAMLSLDASSGL